MGQATAAPGEAYCRACDYSLRGLESQGKCPECGRAFDRADPRTFRPRPRRPVWRLLRWPAYGLLTLTVLAAAGPGWLYLGWQSEQPTIAWIRAQGGSVYTRSIGSPWVQARAGRWTWLLERADHARVSMSASQTEQGQLVGRLTRLRTLHLQGRGVTDELMASVAELTELEQVVFWGSRMGDTQVGDAGLGRLQGLRKLRMLDLRGTRVTDAGLASLPAHRELVRVYLPRMDALGPGVVHLRHLPHLTILCVSGKPTADDSAVATLATLTGLTHLDVADTEMTEAQVTRLRQALPKTMIYTRYFWIERERP